MICVFCYAIVHMLARRGKTRSRKPREGHVSLHEWLVEKRYAMTNFLAIFHVCDTNISNFPTNATRFINIYLRGILTLKKKEIGRWIGGKSVKRFTTKPPYTCTRITPRFTVIKYRVSSPSRKWHPYEGDTSSRVRLLILRQGNKWFDREYEY